MRCIGVCQCMRQHACICNPPGIAAGCWINALCFAKASTGAVAAGAGGHDGTSSAGGAGILARSMIVVLLLLQQQQLLHA